MTFGDRHPLAASRKAETDTARKMMEEKKRYITTTFFSTIIFPFFIGIWRVSALVQYTETPLKPNRKTTHAERNCTMPTLYHPSVSACQKSFQRIPCPLRSPQRPHLGSPLVLGAQQRACRMLRSLWLAPRQQFEEDFAGFGPSSAGPSAAPSACG